MANNHRDAIESLPALDLGSTSFLRSPPLSPPKIQGYLAHKKTPSPQDFHMALGTVLQ